MSPELSALSFRDLGYIIAVARESHFRKAAESCSVSQPTLSAQVKKVERLLRVRIFERSSRTVRLTEAGRRIVDQAALVLEGAEKMAALGHQRRPLVGSVSVGVLGTIGPYLLPPVLPELESGFPELELYIVEGMTAVLADGLRRGTLDLVIASPSPMLGEFREIDACFERFVLCVNSADKLARRKRLKLRELEHKDMLFLGSGHCLADQGRGICARVGANASPFQAASLDTLRLLVAAGRGAALIPELAVAGGTGAGAASAPMLSYVPFREPEVGRMIALYHRKNSPFGEDAELLAELIARCVGQQVGGGAAPAL